MGRLHRYRTALSRRHRSRGFGIHSPFAFNFVLNVLGERLPYYAYGYLHDVRQAVIESSHSYLRHPRVMSLKNAKMLFRITNYFAPKSILQVGTNYGVSAVSMMSVSAQSRLSLYEPHLEEYPVVAQVLEPFLDYIDCFNDLSVAIDEYRQGLSGIEGSKPFVLVNDAPDDEAGLAALITYLKEVIAQADGGVVIMRNLSRSKRMEALWNVCSDHAQCGHTYTNEKIGIIVASCKLPLQHFFLWF